MSSTKSDTKLRRKYSGHFPIFKRRHRMGKTNQARVILKFSTKPCVPFCVQRNFRGVHRSSGCRFRGTLPPVNSQPMAVFAAVQRQMRRMPPRFSAAKTLLGSDRQGRCLRKSKSISSWPFKLSSSRFGVSSTQNRRDSFPLSRHLFQADNLQAIFFSLFSGLKYSVPVCDFLKIRSQTS